MRALASKTRSVVDAFPRAGWALTLAEFAVLAAVLYATRIISLNIWLVPEGDVLEYHQYAIAFWLQHPAFHHFPVEYPPLSILPFSLTLIPPLADYALVFSLWMLAFALAGYAGFLHFSSRRKALVYVFYLVLGAAATILARYDIVPALVTLAALWATERKRFALAYALLAAGILLKLYPVFLVPVVALEQWHVLRANARHGDRATGDELPFWERARMLVHTDAAKHVARGVFWCAGLVTAGFVGTYVLDPSGALSLFAYAGERPIQIESLPASIMWLGTIIGMHAQVDYSFTSLNYVGILSPTLKLLSLLGLAGGSLWVYGRQARRRIPVARAFLAVMAIVLVANKIFSPQYVIWLLPVAAYVEGFDFLWVAIALLTTWDFPLLYQLHHPIERVPFSPLFMPVVALRNGLLLWVTVRAMIRCKEVEGANASAAHAHNAHARGRHGTPFAGWASALRPDGNG